ncbi:MAG: helix-turn-helix domain-containing protein [Caldilineaceae bacterium]
MPSELTQVVLQSGGVYRRRLDVVRIEWSVEQLTKVVKKRLILGTNESSFEISDLADPDFIMAHLKKYGGNVPRGWLEMIRPFFDYYMIHEKNTLSKDTFLLIFQQEPPRVRISSKNLDVYIGYHHLEQLPPQATRVLQYLYEHYGNYCSREELYYCAIQGERKVAQPGDEEYVDVDVWKSSFENVIYQLRKKIEPLAGKSVYIETRRGQGYRLHHVW